MFEVTVSDPLVPGVSDSRDRLEVVPSLPVTIEAVTPILAPLMASISPERVLSVPSKVMVCAVPLPTWMEMEPASVSPALGIALSVPL